MTLIDMLEESPFCDCGKLCIPSKIHVCSTVIKLQANNVIVMNGSTIFYGDSVYCDEHCRMRYQRI